MRTPDTRPFALLPMIGLGLLALMVSISLGTLPYTLGDAQAHPGVPRYNAGSADAGRLPPWWITPSPEQQRRLENLIPASTLDAIAARHGVTPDALRASQSEASAAPALAAVRREAREAQPTWALGTDTLGRSLLLRLLTGGGISLVVGLSAAVISVVVGTLYGALAGWFGGRIDAVMMRIVDVLYGLPYVLLVVLLAVAADAAVEELASRSRARERWVNQTMEQLAPVPRTWGEVAQRAELERTAGAIPPSTFSDRPVVDVVRALSEWAVPRREISPETRTVLDLGTLLIAIGGVSWLTMARVIRGQVLSLKARPFVEAARAMGASPARIFLRHLLPNLTGPIVVYATLTVPQAILQESFLSFLGIGVKPPLPSWGTLAADGLSELNPYQSDWWLLVFPCLLLGITLLAMNFVGEGLRTRLDRRRA